MDDFAEADVVDDDYVVNVADYNVAYDDYVADDVTVDNYVSDRFRYVQD